MNSVQNPAKPVLLSVLFLFGFFVYGVCPADEIVTRKVDLRAPGGGRIHEVRYRVKETGPASDQSVTANALPQATAANVIDSPPLDGFVPWIAITTTDENLFDESITDAIPETDIMGQFTMSDPQSNFAIGIYDTGASSHVMGYANAQTLGIYNPDYLTDNTITVSGVTGQVDAWVTYPLAIYIGGLNILDPNDTPDREAKLADTSAMAGESNVSILVGQEPGTNPDLVTAIGSPMSVYLAASIRNDTPVTVVRNGEEFTGPAIDVYALDDATAPHYSNRLPLELRPLGAVSVQYVPFDLEDLLLNFDDIFNFNLDYTPSSPSVIIGNASQSLFFVHSVDLVDGAYSAIDKSRFMLDTGAQITVIGDRVAARLGLDPQAWEFQVPIEGVNGDTINAPGYYIDSLKIPAIGQWLSYTNVPVVWLNIDSPEGGELDGVIGMNLFREYNLILRGGGFFMGDDPVLEFERIAPVTGDIAPDPVDGQVDMADFSAFSVSWLSTEGQDNWNSLADLEADGKIDLSDLSILAGQWLAGAIQ